VTGEESVVVSLGRGDSEGKGVCVESIADVDQRE
jgi:hypothetical protein